MRPEYMTVTIGIQVVSEVWDVVRSPPKVPIGQDEGLRSKGKWIHQPREVMPPSDPILSEEKD